MDKPAVNEGLESNCSRLGRAMSTNINTQHLSRWIKTDSEPGARVRPRILSFCILLYDKVIAHKQTVSERLVVSHTDVNMCACNCYYEIRHVLL